jgi:3'(2'), 5'-bisphosphate nucleotidase
VNTILYKSFPNDPIIGEEDAGDLRGDTGKELRERVLFLTNSVLDEPLDDVKVLIVIICFKCI